MLVWSFVVAFVVLAAVKAAIPEHKITTLPGFVGDLPSTHYSGCKKLVCTEVKFFEEY